MTKEQRESANRHLSHVAEIVQFAVDEPSPTEARRLAADAKTMLDAIVARWPDE